MRNRRWICLLLIIQMLIILPLFQAEAAQYTTLRYGSKGQEVVEMQQALIDLGYLTGNADGIFGSKTENAVRKFQKACGLQVDGVAGEKTLTLLYKKAEELRAASSSGSGLFSGNYSTIRLGMTGSRVRILQNALKTLSYYSGTVDGKFKTTTRNAVRAFQRANDLTVDGKAGKKTLKALESAVENAADEEEESEEPQTEASYTTLRLGSTGTAVKKLVTELKNQGYYSGSITSRYTTAVQKAVKAFQKAKGLTVDGIAGSATQHALFNTVPVGSGDSSNLPMTLYPAEKINWWTGGINEMWAKGTNYKIYDVKTGIVWWAHRWSGGYHVDAEPLTAADTARLCKCYGVTTSQEIANKNLYQRRPCLVTIGNRTFACSLYGVPHNYPDGDTISTNEFRGQLCIHFTKSWTHGSKRVDSLHAAAIQYAWENSPSGNK